MMNDTQPFGKLKQSGDAEKMLTCMSSSCRDEWHCVKRELPNVLFILDLIYPQRKVKGVKETYTHDSIGLSLTC
jgi:hypothetical protein